MEESVTEHYGALLQLEKPWRVTAVEKDLVGERVVVCVQWPEERRWRARNAVAAVAYTITCPRGRGGI